MRVSFDESGRILCVASADQPAFAGSFGSVVVETDALPKANQVYWDVVTAALMPRPALDLPDQIALTAGGELIIADVPKGSEIISDGVLVGVADGTVVNLTYPVAGVWSLRVVPPFPWRESICEVTVA